MNPTDTKDKNGVLLDEQVDSMTPRRSPGELDEHYILAYLEQPEAGKTAALRKAGFTGKIEQALETMMSESTILGHKVIRRLATESDSEATQLNAARMLMDYGGRKPTDKLLVNEPDRTPEEIDAEIAIIQRRIEEAQGL